MNIEDLKERIEKLEVEKKDVINQAQTILNRLDGAIAILKEFIEKESPKDDEPESNVIEFPGAE